MFVHFSSVILVLLSRTFIRGMLMSIFCLSMALGQGDTLMLDSLAQNHEKLDIRRNVAIYAGDSKGKSFRDIYDNQNAAFSKLPENTISAGESWTKLTLRNTGSDTLELIYYLGYHTMKEMYISVGDAGNRRQMSIPKELFDYKDQFSASLHILPYQQVTYWFKSSPFLFARDFRPLLFSKTGYRNYKKMHSDGSMYNFGFRAMIIGLCFFLGLFAFVQSVYSRDRTYAFWGFYLWCNFAYFFTGLDRHFNLGILNETGKPWSIAAQFPVQIAYLLFINSFLMVSRYDRRTFQIIRAAILIMACGFVVAIYAIWVGNGPLRTVMEAFTFITDLAILLIFIRIVKKGVPQTRLLMIGSLGILTAAIAAALVDQLDLMQFDVFWFYPVTIFSLGVCFELVFFSMALSERTDQIKVQNQQLQADYTKKLEADLAERLQLIKNQDILMEDQRIQHLTREFEQRIAQTEIASLRSQMNPHFIFNCLNSIKLYMMENNSAAASDYLTKFSSLIRSVLDNSRSDKISLERELDTLRLYAELEVMRFKEKVKFELNVAPGIDLLFVEIPPLLVQPFVENAIWHGLMHQDGGGTVKVDITQPGAHQLHIEISDNGVGREMSEILKSKNATFAKSYGMKVTSERIDLVNQMYSIDTKYQVHDLYNETGKPIGTTVILEISI